MQLGWLDGDGCRMTTCMRLLVACPRPMIELRCTSHCRQEGKCDAHRVGTSTSTVQGDEACFADRSFGTAGRRYPKVFPLPGWATACTSLPARMGGQHLQHVKAALLGAPEMPESPTVKTDVYTEPSSSHIESGQGPPAPSFPHGLHKRRKWRDKAVRARACLSCTGVASAKPSACMTLCTSAGKVASAADFPVL